MPPEGFPVWLWTVLGVILPLVYQSFLGKRPGTVKFLISWGLSALIVVLVGVIFLHYTPGQFLTAFVWVVAAMQAVYSLLVKPVVRKLDSSKVKL
jgi:FtsH-binding integral membrane protein